MKNKLTDLNDHLFCEIERLGDEELTGEELKNEIARAESIANVADKIIANGTLILKANLAASREIGIVNLPRMLDGRSNEEK